MVCTLETKPPNNITKRLNRPQCFKYYSVCCFCF